MLPTLQDSNMLGSFSPELGEFVDPIERGHSKSHQHGGVREEAPTFQETSDKSDQLPDPDCEYLEETTLC